MPKTLYKPIHWTTAVLLMSSLALVSGCSSEETYEFVPVSGRLTLDGKPLSNVRITFTPKLDGDNIIVGPSSMATTDADGRFQLVAANKSFEKGAIVGEHRVYFQEYPPAVEDPPANIDPAEYYDESLKNSPVQTFTPLLSSELVEGLVFTVPPEGTDSADFEYNSQ
ncbi:DUF4198 domain-containing protein [Calycomorphotria hydatis]|uniref:DUF6795 domain-containing protein n=1 Tax=Calycomorphotria hydatis TaxID=2528027 RepID=A0A517T8H9_9PLAN|nr:DUF4198 domain-containing protein [Calycomorphotria hydatis]QDT64694.1 hypothetical protein V22_19350 [Calycomorphotria hydatis]